MFKTTKSSIARLSILLFWFVTTGWLIRYEAFPHWFTSISRGYGDIFEGGPFIRDSWMQITFDDAVIGYSHTWLDSDIEGRVESYILRNTTVLNLTLLGENQNISVLVQINLNDNYLMQAFATTLHSRSYKTHIQGRRIGKEKFEVDIHTPGGTRKTSVSVPDDVMLHSPIAEMAVKRMKPGDSLRLRVLDPISLTVSDVTTEAVRRERIPHAGDEIIATVMKTTYMGMEMLSWIDSDGYVLRHETPFGWVMTACPADEILMGPSGQPDGGDILSAMAVPYTGAIIATAASESLSIGITGVHLDIESISSHRQDAEQAEDYIKMTITAQNMPSVALSLESSIPEEYSRYLRSSPYIQADHPKIIQTAESITANAGDRFEAAKAISDWIQRNLQMRPTISLPSALDVLEQLEGDCNEITYLFVALARAVGIPARIHVGLAYASPEGRSAFYYHAWPSVYVGEWVEMDPTWGLATVSATHISLVTGEIADQLKLLPIMGRARIHILSGGE